MPELPKNARFLKYVSENDGIIMGDLLDGKTDKEKKSWRNAAFRASKLGLTKAEGRGHHVLTAAGKRKLEKALGKVKAAPKAKKPVTAITTKPRDIVTEISDAINAREGSDKTTSTRKIMEMTHLSHGEIGEATEALLKAGKIVRINTALWAPMKRGTIPKAASVTVAVTCTLDDAFTDAANEIDRLINTVVAVTGANESEAIGRMAWARHALDEAKVLVMAS